MIRFKNMGLFLGLQKLTRPTTMMENLSFSPAPTSMAAPVLVILFASSSSLVWGRKVSFFHFLVRSFLLLFFFFFLGLPGIDPDGVLSWKVDVLVRLGRVQWSLIRPGVVWCIFVIEFLVFGVWNWSWLGRQSWRSFGAAGDSVYLASETQRILQVSEFLCE